MTISHEFRYEKPKTVGQVIKLLSEYGSRARILAGGTDLIGWLRDDLIAPDILIDIKGVDGLQTFSLRKATLWVGPRVTITDILESDSVRKYYPLWMEMATMLACSGIRNRATVVGNVCSAVPCCDNGPILLVYDAVMRAEGPTGRRDISMQHWFEGPRKTALHPGELITLISVPKPRLKNGGCFVKLKRYRGEDLAQASVAVLALADGEYRIAFGSVAPTPVRAPRIEALLRGNQLTDRLIASAQTLIPEETAPITDIRSTKEYRAHMLKVMLERALRTAVARLDGSGPAYGVNVIE